MEKITGGELTLLLSGGSSLKFHKKSSDILEKHKFLGCKGHSKWQLEKKSNHPF